MLFCLDTLTGGVELLDLESPNFEPVNLGSLAMVDQLGLFSHERLLG